MRRPEGKTATDTEERFKALPIFRGLLLACRRGNLDIVQMLTERFYQELLDETWVDELLYYLPLNIYYRNKSSTPTVIFDLFVRHCPMIYPSLAEGILLRAIIGGHGDIVRRLFGEFSEDTADEIISRYNLAIYPIIDIHALIIITSIYGRLDIYRTIERFSTSVDKTTAIRLSAKHRHVAMCRSLYHGDSA